MYERILVPVDGSETAERGLDEAVRLARLAGGRLRLVHVIDELSLAVGLGSYGGLSAETVQLLRDGGRTILDAAVARVRAQGIEVDSVLVDNFSSRVAEQVLQQAADWRADLVVIGTHGRRGLPRLLLGSDAEQIIRLATTPVLLVRGGAAAPAL